ncbi:MAG: hypothetical protein CVU49_04060 [Candidatus Cloacimonetes bacterium HGW-Cloacimonetes-2]|nr:MAG: hypothetical protein CVU49_04060 [Candidatus Cloacimonetes bacterium HGW-Cloacimonetes-2]
MKESREYLCYCGLYCKMCSIVNGLPQAAGKLEGIMREDGWEYYGAQLYPEFDAFWSVLSELKQLDETSPLCKGGCGDPGCAIRACAISKELEVCALCDDFPCRLLKDFTARYPFLIENGERIRELGIETWLCEQDALVARGITNKSLIKH